MANVAFRCFLVYQNRWACSTGEALGTGKESMWVWGCVGALGDREREYVEMLGTGKENFIGVGVGVGIGIDQTNSTSWGQGKA